MGALYVLADRQTNLVDAVNRSMRRDMGQAEYGQQVLWTQYDGANPARNGTAATTGNYTQTIRSAATGGLHAAYVLSATTAAAALTPTTANSAVLIKDAGLLIGAGKSLVLYATAGANNADLSADAAGNLVLGGTTGALTLNGNVRWKSGTAFVMELDHAATADRVITVPDATDTLALLGRAQTFSAINTFSSSVRLADGSAATPALGFTSDTNTGLRWLSADRMWFVAGGSDVMQVANTGTVLGVGIGAAPSVPFHVNTTQSADYIAIIEQTSSSSGRKGMQIKSANTTASDVVLQVESNSSAALQVFGDRSIALAGQPRARVYNSATISHTPASAWQSLTFNSERYDVGALHSTSSFTNRLTAPSAGSYRMGGCIQFASSATGFRGIRIVLNGTTNLVQHYMPAGAVGGNVLAVATEYDLAASDYVELQGWQDSGGALDMTVNANATPEFWISRYA